MTGNIPPSYKVKTGKKTLTEDVKNDIYELPDSYFVKAIARVFDKIENGKGGVLPSSTFVDLVETLGVGGFIVKSCGSSA